MDHAEFTTVLAKIQDEILNRDYPVDVTNTRQMDQLILIMSAMYGALEGIRYQLELLTQNLPASSQSE